VFHNIVSFRYRLNVFLKMEVGLRAQAAGFAQTICFIVSSESRRNGASGHCVGQSEEAVADI
jgi:hypothetical protein